MVRSSGFTLVEIMVVVVILSILAAIVVPKIMSRPDQARTARVQQDIRALASALDLYRLDNFKYPTTDDGLEALVSRPSSLTSGANWKEGGYVKKIPKDPWGNPYLYLQPGSHGDFDLYSLGSDGVTGGEGANTDIGNWDLE
nr:type II secretion system major pseudopilin GspG [Sedimenticola hydrogenitrophicus]